MFVLKYKLLVRSKMAAVPSRLGGQQLTPIRHLLALEIISDAPQINADYGECHEGGIHLG
jgi:hypothetical protein